MSATRSRLRRLLTEELGDCCDADVQARINTLETLETTLPTDYSTDLAAVDALSTDTRYRIIRLLDAADEQLCVCELNLLLDVSESAISHALTTLHNAALVTSHQTGTWKYYTTTPRATHLITALDTTRETPQ